MNVSQIALKTRIATTLMIMIVALLILHCDVLVAGTGKANSMSAEHVGQRPNQVNAVPSQTINFSSDAVLIHFLMTSDAVLSRVAGTCSGMTVKRYKSNGLNHFHIEGFCNTKQLPQEDLDCGGYDITATGTIDNKVQATIRKITLDLVCSNEGRD